MQTDLTQAGLIIRSSEGEQQYALMAGRSNSFDALHVDFQVEELAGGTRYSVFLHPKLDCTVQQLEVQLRVSSADVARFLANGFQSESLSGKIPFGAAIKRLHPFARPFLKHTGDEQLDVLPPDKGVLHSWTFAGIADDKDGKMLLAGSLNERTGFTLFLFDPASGLLQIRKDLKGLQLTHSFPGLEFWVGQGREAERSGSVRAIRQSGRC